MRPHTDATGDLVVGVDLGGTKILCAVVGPDGAILGSDKRPTDRGRGPEGVTLRIAESIRAALESAGREAGEVGAIGLGAPGPLDPDAGVILTTPNLGWKDFAIASSLEGLVGRPVFLENDVKLAAFGEARRGACVGARSVVGLWFGTGVGGAIILDGHIHSGASKNAAEIGHHTVMAGGPKCGCGVRGHLEAVASRTAVERDLREAVEKGKKTSLAKALSKKSGQIKGAQLRRAYEEGDEVVRKRIHSVAKYAGIGVANVLNMLSPERVVLGGGILEAFGDLILERIRKSARAHCFPIAYASSEIVLAQLGERAGVVGAAEYARERLAGARAAERR